MTGDGLAQTQHEALYHQDVIRRLLALREDLVRHDENLKAFRLLEAAPYFVAEHPAIVKARDEQYVMVRHVLPADELRPEDRERDPYADYYCANEYEAPFEQVYGLTVDTCDRLPRVRFLLDSLQEHALSAHLRASGELHVLDLAGNDGWMAARLAKAGHRAAMVDLNDANIALAKERAREYGMGFVVQCAAEDAPEEWSRGSFDAVVAYELIEHVADPRRLLGAMTYLVRAGGLLFVSTPHGAVEQGNTPWPPVVEPKGHVRVFTEPSFRALLEEFGEVEELVRGEDGVLVARVRPG